MAVVVQCNEVFPYWSRIACAIWWTVEGFHIILLLLFVHNDWKANYIRKELWGKVEQKQEQAHFQRLQFRLLRSQSFCTCKIHGAIQHVLGWEPVYWLDGATAARAHLREGCIPLKMAGTAASTGLAIAEWSQTARCSAAGEDCWTAECPYHPNQLTLFDLVTSTNWTTAVFISVLDSF